MDELAPAPAKYKEGNTMLKKIAAFLVTRGEKRIGVPLDYAHKIARTDFGLMARYGKIFGFLDPNKHASTQAYHVARLRGALAADCGTCVEAEMNLARQSGMNAAMIDTVLRADYAALPDNLAAVARLSDAVVNNREDDPEARAEVQAAFGEAGLIELSFAMNGAALLPGIKRAMGFATVCNLDVLRRQG